MTRAAAVLCAVALGLSACAPGPRREPREAEATYRPVLEALVAAVGSTPSAPTSWEEPMVGARREEGTCHTFLYRRGDGLPSQALDRDALRRAVDGSLRPRGFGSARDVAGAGGAVLVQATDDRGARARVESSPGSTQVVIRVPAPDGACR